MDYRTASAFYAEQLKIALEVHRHAYALTQLSQVTKAGVGEEHKSKLKKAFEPAKTLMQRLDEGQFRIAVVGLEKAGKSTFVNAWLGCDLLPAKQERCTFTTTQIYSVKDGQERLETLPKSVSSFEEYLSELKEQELNGSESAKETAKKDLEVISDNSPTLNEVVAEGCRTFPILNKLEDIKPELTKYVADERYAHAMREARLYTKDLAAVDGVVFFDVPGLNSGLSKHIEETKSILADCDAIIMVQSNTITLVAHEQKVVEYAKDPYMSISDKLFVFWGRIDTQPNKTTLNKNFQKVIDEWSKFGVPEKRIVKGSAGAHLVLLGYPIDQVGERSKVLRNMREITELENEEDIKQETGIVELQQKIQHYLDHERTALLKSRCDEMMQDIIGAADEIYQLVKQRYPEDPQAAQRLQADNRNKLWSHWWGKRWNQIEAEVITKFDERKSKFEQLGLEDEGLQKFKSRYELLVKAEMQKLPSREETKRQEIFVRSSSKGFNPDVANAMWRVSLFEDVNEMLKSMSKGMAFELQTESEKIVNELRDLLWGSDQVKNELIPNIPQYLKDLERSLNTLFLRFVRPITELLIFAPLGSSPREKMRDKLGADIEIIDNYYTGDEPAFERVGRYVNHGASLLLDKNKRINVLGSGAEKILGSGASIAKMLIKTHPLGRLGLPIIEGISETIVENFSEKLANKQDSDNSIDEQSLVIQEVEADLQAFEHYLLHGIFAAAGFQAFCLQELESLKDNFLKDACSWDAVARNEWEKGNDLLLKELPAELQKQEFDTLVSDKLKQLGISLGKVKPSLY